MFYLVVIPVLLLMLYTWRQMVGLQKHDEVLFRFCQIRRELMAFLREEGTSLSAEDYRFARLFVDILHQTIHNYNQHKKRIFNFRDFLCYLKQFRASADDLGRIPKTVNPRLVQLRHEFGVSMLRGFFTFTPLFRHETALKVLLFIVATAAKRYLVQAKEFAVTLRRQMAEFGQEAIA